MYFPDSEKFQKQDHIWMSEKSGHCILETVSKKILLWYQKTHPYNGQGRFLEFSEDEVC